MSKKTEPTNTDARTLAREVREAEEGVVAGMNAFIIADDVRSRRRALTKIKIHEKTKASALEKARCLDPEELRAFIGFYTCARIDEQGAKLASFADKLAKEVKAVVVPEQPIVVVCQDWEESESGWGIRPDGFSLHFTREDCKKYIAAYWAKMPDEVPDEYSRPSGEPYVVRIPSKSKWHLDLTTSAGKLGARYFSSDTRPEKV